MATWPATTGFVGGWAWAQKLAVGFLATELAQAPRALHSRDRLERCDKAGGHRHGQHQAAQFPAKGSEPGQYKTANERNNGQQAQDDDHLFGAIVQDVFKKVTVPANEATRI
ncbi:hypothetical protein D3C85_982320 [compost metagenome]